MRVNNPYEAPTAAVRDIALGENTSGMGKAATIPDGVAGWSWGAFLLNWIWAIGNSTWIGLLAIVPYVGLIFSIMLGIKGREWAWRNKRWDSVEHFQRVQRKWTMWSLIIIVGVFVLAMVAAIAIPKYQDYAGAAQGG
jgi:hypothetical protein